MKPFHERSIRHQRDRRAVLTLRPDAPLNNRIRFCINVDAPRRAQLAESFRLLALSKIVHGDGNKNGE
jgi:hypothetical protein